MTETKGSGQPKDNADNTATSTETLSDIEKNEVAAKSDGSAYGEGNRSATEATPDGQFDSASEEGAQENDGGPM